MRLFRKEAEGGFTLAEWDDGFVALSRNEARRGLFRFEFERWTCCPGACAPRMRRTAPGSNAGRSAHFSSRPASCSAPPRTCSGMPARTAVVSWSSTSPPSARACGSSAITTSGATRFCSTEARWSGWRASLSAPGPVSAGVPPRPRPPRMRVRRHLRGDAGRSCCSSRPLRSLLGCRRVSRRPTRTAGCSTSSTSRVPRCGPA